MLAAIAVYELVYRQVLVKYVFKNLTLSLPSFFIVLSLVVFIAYFFPFQMREPIN
jgi:hypothetical protein